ncbi:MAG: membrane dipeptidase, partial [Phycisphaerales bacterium]|nr:membrane dipeptidase [Phycisphaerales bacterium]
MLSWFDGHLDLAYLAEIGRDLHAPPETCLGRLQPAAITFPSLDEGRVRAVLATIFTEAVDASDPRALDVGPFAYAPDDVEGANRAGMRQLKLYAAWRDAGILRLLGKRGSPVPPLDEGPLVAGILMESADPIRDPDDLNWWVDQGVVAVGLAWWRGTRYAAGNGLEPGAPGDGLTSLGRDLVRRLDELGVVHDVSHLSERATLDLFEMTSATPIA